jgi:hypothetical protein
MLSFDNLDDLKDVEQCRFLQPLAIFAENTPVFRYLRVDFIIQADAAHMLAQAVVSPHRKAALRIAPLLARVLRRLRTGFGLCTTWVAGLGSYQAVGRSLLLALPLRCAQQPNREL